MNGIQGFRFLQKKTARVNMTFLYCKNFCIRNNINLELQCEKEFRPFFVLNESNVLEENKKLTRIRSSTLTYIAMKDTLKKVFSEISSMEYKIIPAIKEEVETVNLYGYQSSKEQKTYRGNKTNSIDRQGKIMCCLKSHLAKHFD